MSAALARLRRYARLPARDPDRQNSRLLLSNTVRVHRKLREVGVGAQLDVYEGQSHAQYQFEGRVLKTKKVFGEITLFLDRHQGH